MANSTYTPGNVLSSANVIAGSYGNSAQNLQIVVDSTGRLSATPVPINIANWPSMPSINGGQLGGLRNALINGDMAIWQRGTSFTPPADVYTYAADRWAPGRGVVGQYTVSRQIANLPGFLYSIRAQRNSSTSALNAIVLSQPITSQNSYRFQGKNITISFWARCGANFSSSGSILNAFVISGTGIDQATNILFTGQASVVTGAAAVSTSWQRFTFTSASVAGSSISQIACTFSYTPTGTAGANDWFEITGVQVEEGSTATAFEYLPFEYQYRICQQYYEKSFNYATVPATGSGEYGFVSPQIVAASVNCFYSVPFKVRKRTTTPSIVLFNPTSANAQARNFVFNSDFSATTLSTINDFNFGFTATSPASSTPGNLISVNWTADSEIY